MAGGSRVKTTATVLSNNTVKKIQMVTLLKVRNGTEIPSLL